MEFKSRFNLGDEVFVIDGRKIAHKKIDIIKIVYNEMLFEPVVRYHFEGDDRNSTVLEEMVASSKDELIGKLIS